jgi:hypothetical protein
MAEYAETFSALTINLDLDIVAWWMANKTENEF